MNNHNARTLALAALILVAPSVAQASAMSVGDAAYKAGSYSAAATSFRQAAEVTTGPEQAKAYYKEGLAFHKLHQDTQAVSAYNQAQTADPTFSFASSPDKFQHNLQVAQKDAGSTTSVPARTSGTYSTNTTTVATPEQDPVATALSAGDVYIAPQFQTQINQTRLQAAARASENLYVKIAVLNRLPPGYPSVEKYTQALSKYLDLGNNGLIVVVAHGPGAGVADIGGKLSQSASGRAQESALSQKYIAQIGRGDYTNALTAMTAELASIEGAAVFKPYMDLLIVFLVVCAVIAFLLISASRRKKVQLGSMRGPLEQTKNGVLSGIEYLDSYIDVLPKNNADSDQVRAFRQAAAYKVDQAAKIMVRSTEVTDLNRAQNLLDQADADVQNGRRYLDRATGGKGDLKNDDAVQPVPFPVNQQQVNQIPADQRGVSFFSSQPAPVASLVPVTLNIDGQQRTVMASPDEARAIQRGQIPPVRSFNVGGQSVPWYAYQNYDPYNDYYTYQNNGWRGIAGGAIAGFVGAELLDSLFRPHNSWGYGGWNSPYAYGPGFDSWGGWGNNDYGWNNNMMGGGGMNPFNDQYNAPQQDQDLAGGASFMNTGYDTTDYGNDNSAGGSSFMGGDRS